MPHKIVTLNDILVGVFCKSGENLKQLNNLKQYYTYCIFINLIYDSPVKVFWTANRHQAVSVRELGKAPDFIILFKTCTDCHSSANEGSNLSETDEKQHSQCDDNKTKQTLVTEYSI